MSRKLSLAIIAVAAALIIPSLAVSQESDSCQKCPNCHAIEFELAGVDFPLTGTEQDKTSKQEATSKKNEIAIQIECNCDIPFLNSLPLINHIFGASSTEECEIFVIDAKNDNCCGTCCDTCKDGCNGCEQCSCTCCGDKQKDVKVEVICSGEVPFLSSMPYINSLFKNVGVTSAQARECQDGDCPAACAKTECPTACCGDSTCATPVCRADALLQLASHNEASNAEKPSTEKLKHELMELHMENERLEAKLQAMAHHMELMEEIFNVRAENAALKAQLKLMELRKAETSSVKHLHRPIEIHRVAEHLRAMRMELNNENECSKSESDCKKASSK